MSIDKVNLATVEKMWRREVEAAATYKHLAERERDPKRRDILLRLAEQEDKHAARWSERIAASTGRVPDPGQMGQPGPGLTPRTCRVSSTRISATTGARHSPSSAPPCRSSRTATSTMPWPKWSFHPC